MNVISHIMISFIQMTVLLIMLRVAVVYNHRSYLTGAWIYAFMTHFKNLLEDGLNRLLVAMTHDA